MYKNKLNGMHMSLFVNKDFALNAYEFRWISLVAIVEDVECV